jgi:hypothetical protein
MNVSGTDNFNLVHDVSVSLGAHNQINLISDRNVFQPSEETVAVPGDSSVARITQRRGSSDTSNAPVQRQVVRSFEDRDSDFHLRNLEHSQRKACGIQQTAFVGLNAFRRPETEIDISIGPGWFRHIILYCGSLRVLKVPQCKSGKNLPMEQRYQPDGQKHRSGNE